MHFRDKYAILKKRNRLRLRKGNDMEQSTSNRHDEGYFVPLSRIIAERSLETVYLPDLPENILVTNAGVNRPGLQFAGFYDHYEPSRLQIIGKVEHLGACVYISCGY